jgi:predicted enzyme related to lactoylglutathione lyase
LFEHLCHSIWDSVQERRFTMPRVVHFEIPSDDPGRAVAFYEQAFGWEINRWEGQSDYWLITTGKEGEPGIDGAIMRREEQKTTVNTIDVPSYEEFAQRVEESGGKILTPKMAIPGVGYHSYCMDTEGNVFGIMQDDPTAK